MMGFMFPGMMFFMVLGLAVFSAGLVFIRRFLKGPPSSEKKSGETARNSIQREIFKLARTEGGSITVSDVVLVTGLSIAEAEKALNDIADGFRVRMDVTDSGIVRYVFTELEKNQGD